MNIYVQCLFLFCCGANPACLTHQLRGDATPRGRSGAVVLQGLPRICQQVRGRTTGPVQPPLVNKRELRARVQRRQTGTAGFALSWSGVKKGRAARIGPSCFGGMVWGRCSLCMLCEGEGSCSGTMVLDKRQPSDRNLSREKKNSHK